MAKKTDQYRVDGAPLFVPLSPFKVEIESLADPNSGRTDDGIMHVLFVRPKVRKFSYQCGRLNGEELRYLENLVQGKSYNFTFNEHGQPCTIRAYTSNIQYNTVDLVAGIYDNVQFSIIEE